MGKELPAYALEFLNTCIILLADHGPGVSGAVNTIVTTRAGKDMVSSLVA
jgi:ATP citrate (pro-S)-lyase